MPRQYPCQIENYINTSKSSWKTEMNFSFSALVLMKTRVSLKYFVNDCLRKHFFASNWSLTSSNWISLNVLVTLRPFTQFWPKIRAIKTQKSPKICLAWQLLFRPFHWDQNLVFNDFPVCFYRFFRKIK